MAKKKHTIPELAGRIERLERAALEHHGIDLAAYDEAAEEAKAKWIEENPDHAENTMVEPDPEPEEPAESK